MDAIFAITKGVIIIARFRKIKVNDKMYEWLYSFDDYDWHEPSHLVIRTQDKSTKLILYFSSEDNGVGHCPFNTGVNAIKDGEQVLINLNQPRFIAEIIIYLFDEHIEYISKDIQYIDGLKILRELGYRFEYRYNIVESTLKG